MKRIVIVFLALFLSLASVSASYSQCAMCRATVESNSKTGDKAIGRGLNAGILYLMVIPYILISVVGYLWYTNSKKNAKMMKADRESKKNSSVLPGSEIA